MFYSHTANARTNNALRKFALGDVLLVVHLLREQGVGDSNSLAPTIYKKSDPKQGRSFLINPTIYKLKLKSLYLDWFL